MVGVTHEWIMAGYYSEAGSAGTLPSPIFRLIHMWVPLVSFCSVFWAMASASGVKNLVVFGDSYAGKSSCPW